MENFVPVLLTILGLILIVFSNNIMGTMNAFATNSFDADVCKKGLLKACGVLLGLISAYVSGMLNPDIAIGMVNGQSMTMAQAVSTIVFAAYGVYGYKFIQKCVETFNLKVTVQEVSKPGETNELTSSQRGS